MAPEWDVAVSIVTNANDGLSIPWIDGALQIMNAFALTDLRHLRPGRRAQIVEMIGSGLENLRKRSATKIHILLTFPQFVPIL